MLLIKNGRVIDPANGVDDLRNVLVDQGAIVEVRPGGTGKAKENGADAGY